MATYVVTLSFQCLANRSCMDVTGVCDGGWKSGSDAIRFDIVTCRIWMCRGHGCRLCWIAFTRHGGSIHHVVTPRRLGSICSAGDRSGYDWSLGQGGSSHFDQFGLSKHCPNGDTIVAVSHGTHQCGIGGGEFRTTGHVRSMVLCGGSCHTIDRYPFHTVASLYSCYLVWKYDRDDSQFVRRSPMFAHCTLAKILGPSGATLHSGGIQ